MNHLYGRTLLTTLTLQAVTLLLPASSSRAETSAATVLHEAVENAVSAANYSWSSTLLRPDGQTATATGQVAGTESLVTVTDEKGQHLFAQSGDKRFVKKDGGAWTLLSRPARPAQISETHAQAGRPDHPRGHRGGATGLGPRGRHTGLRLLTEPAGRHLDMVIDHVDQWTINGAIFVGEFQGMVPPAGRRGPRSERAPDTVKQHTGTVSLTIQNGLVSTVSIQGSASWTEANGANQQKQHSVTTTFSHVGTTAVTLPAEVKALLTSG